MAGEQCAQMASEAMEARLRGGAESYASKDYTEALKQFTRVCPPVISMTEPMLTCYPSGHDSLPLHSWRQATQMYLQGFRGRRGKERLYPQGGPVSLCL